MARPGELYDQDEVGRPAGEDARTGGRRSQSAVFDQDATQDASNHPGASPRPSGHAIPPAVSDQPERRARERQRERQRDRELVLRRRQEWERQREARRRAARTALQEAAAASRARHLGNERPPAVTVGDAAWLDPSPSSAVPIPGWVPVRARPPGPRRATPSSRAASEAAPIRGSVPEGDSAAWGGTGSVGRATAVLALGTLASRLTGFLRVLAVGYVLGVGALSDAYNYANGVPNIVYDLLLGGVLSATLIPVFVEHLGGQDRHESMRAVSAVLTAITAALAVATAVLWLVAPWVIRAYLVLDTHHASGPQERLLGTQLLHYFAPQVFFLGAIVVTTALLNARRHFAAAAVSPVVNNLIAIAAILATKAVASSILESRSPGATVVDRFRHDEKAVLILGLGTTAGYVVQFVIHIPALRRAGLRLRPVWDLRHPAVRRVLTLSTWLVGVVVANQVSLAVVMILAGRQAGGVTAYQYSFQFFLLPYALIAVSVASALMPDLAERWARGDERGFRRQLIMGTRVTLALLVPAAVGYVAVAQPLISLTLHHGRVTAAGAHLVTSSLILFAVGLPGFSAFFLLMRAYQAIQDARRMFWIYALENALTVVAALVLDPVLGVPGLALAWVGPYTVASVVAAWDLRRRVGSLGGSLTLRALWRIVVASAAMLAVIEAVGAGIPGGGGDAGLVGLLVAQVGLGGVTYLAVGRWIGITELHPVMRIAGRLKPRRASR